MLSWCRDSRECYLDAGDTVECFLGATDSRECFLGAGDSRECSLGLSSFIQLFVTPLSNVKINK
jgi:hypothetical protein